MADAWVLVVHRHSRALMCLWVSLLGCVRSHASVVSDPRRFRRVLLAGSCGYLYTPHTISHLGTPDVILPITSTHWGGYPPIWYKAGITRMLGPGAGIGLCCCRWPSWLWPGGSMLYRIGNSSPHSAPWEPRVHVRTRPEDPATHRATPAMLGRGGDCGRP